MQLAQLNIARLRASIDSPELAEFVAGLAPINALADAAPGFVWRLQTDDGDATSVRAHPDPDVIVNMSVWASPHALGEFVFRSAHTPFLRRRRSWFVPMSTASSVAWWVHDGHQPDLDEAFGRLAFLDQHGASPYAFVASRPAVPLSITAVPLEHDDAQTLIAELDADLTARYPEPGSTFFKLDPREVSGTNGVFLVAELDGQAVACGAFRKLTDEPGAAEIKRMFVRPAVRGNKLGAAVLAELERHALTMGVTRMKLETGERQVEAASVYTTAGYRPCPCWGDYAHAPLSRCYAKELMRV